MRAALELMPQLVWTTTPDGYHDYYNEQWYRYTGMPRPGDPAADADGAGDPGWNWKNYLHPDDYDRTVAVWARCLATGAPYEIEYRFKEAATGTYRWFLGRALPLRHAEVDGVPGRIVRWFGTCTDIDEQRRAAEQLQEQAAELEATAQQLQEQQVELEVASQQLHEQQAELEAQAEALTDVNANLEAALADAVRARRAADAARQAAEAARARTAAVLEATADAYFALDADFRIVAVNGAMARGSGLARDQLLGRDFWAAFPGAAGTVFETHYRRAASEGVAAHFTHDYSDGRLDLVVDVDAYPAEGGGVAVFWRDVTARARADAERERLLAAERLAAGRARLLQELTAAFSAALTPEAVVRVVLEHGVPALGAVTGLVLLAPADGVLGGAASDGGPAADGTDSGMRLALAGAHGYPTGFTSRFAGLSTDAPLPIAAAARERRAVWVEDAEGGVAAYPGLAAVYAATGAGATAALPLEDAAGRVVGALAFNFPGPRRFDEAARAFKASVARQCAQALDRARLFAAEHAAREAAEAAYAAAEAASRAKGQFLATMSHELRTPLNAIAGYAELLAMGVRGALTDAQQADLARLRRANQHLTALVTDVLNFARLDAGRVAYRAEALPLGPLVADLETLVGPQLAVKGLVFDHAGCGPQREPPETPDQPHVGGPLAVRADPDHVRQILLNLLTNAVKFTDRGGRVSLTCEADAAGAVRVRVSDTGRGIAPDQLERVFEPFVQVDRDLTHVSQQGVGLGLAISRDLARGMGGNLTAESTPGVGSTFTLTLPAAI